MPDNKGPIVIDFYTKAPVTKERFNELVEQANADTNGMYIGDCLLSVEKDGYDVDHTIMIVPHKDDAERIAFISLSNDEISTIRDITEKAMKRLVTLTNEPDYEPDNAA